MNIIGHDKIINLLNRSITRGIISHAYLFSGLEHAGKFAVALDFAQRLAGGGIDLNPDLIIIKPEIGPASTRSPRFGEAGGGAASTRGGEKKGIIKKADIKIEQIRDLQHQLSLTATKGKYKVAIIDDADRLNKMAQNALLKTLEEPNEKIVLILVSQNDKKLLPTILSRCQRMKFGPVAREVLEKNIPAGEKNKEEIIFWSLGRPGLMLGLLEDKSELDFRKNTAAELKKILDQNAEEKFSLAESLSKDSRSAVKKLNLWTIILHESLLGKDETKIKQKKAFEIIRQIEKSLELIRETNSNTRLILENLFLNF